MQIQEGESNEEQLISYQFEPLANPVLEDKVFSEMLTKWGLKSTLQVFSFRFNQKYDDLSSQDFFKDLFNDKNFKSVLSSLLSYQSLDEIKTTKLKCTQTKIDMFEKLSEFDVTSGDNIRMCMPDFQDEIEIQSHLRQAILQEESEYYDAFSEYEREEFLYHIFTILVLGGAMCQYEDLMSPYLEWTKFFYKNLISARKDTETENIFVESQVYAIEKVGNQTFSGDHPQNRFYVCINPSVRSINIITNQWKSFW